MQTCEDALEKLADREYKLESSDVNLIHSLARQTFKGIAYTDRQYDLAKQKVLQYKSQYEANGYTNIESCIESLRLPLRSIDRSRWIKIVDHPGDMVHENNICDHWIALRFIFQKKLISNVNLLKEKYITEYYDKENKIHYFPFTEKNVKAVLSLFNESNNFEIQEELKEYYQKLIDMENNKQDCLPGVYNFTLKNLNSKSLDYAMTTIGEPCTENLFQYYDQREKLGLGYFDSDALYKSLRTITPLSSKIVSRTKQKIFVSNKKYTLNNVTESLLELDKFPLLIILNENHSYDELIQFHKAFNGIVSNEQCSVLFRLDNDKDGYDFNHYIHTNNLNSPVDKNTKIVYISNNKIPKPLLKSNWSPISVLSTQSGKTYGNKSEIYVNGLDLILYFETEPSYYHRDLIEKI